MLLIILRLTHCYLHSKPGGFFKTTCLLLLASRCISIGRNYSVYISQMEFDHEFDTLLSNIENSLNAEHPDSNVLLRQIDEAHALVKRNLDTLSTRDREKCDTRLQQAREKIWKLKKPKRFQFKSAKIPPKAAPKSHPDPSNRDRNDARKRVRTVHFDGTPKPNSNFSDMEKSVIIDLDVTGALHLTNVQRSIVVVKCLQCRIHDCTDLDIQLEGCTNPVIENSSGIHFYVPEPESVHVSDFSHMRPESNPNYTLDSLTMTLSRTTKAPISNKPVASYTADDAHKLYEFL